MRAKSKPQARSKTLAKKSDGGLGGGGGGGGEGGGAEQDQPSSRRSTRIAENEAEMHEDALAKTKDMFEEMGKEMQAAEDEAAVEDFTAMLQEREQATGTCCVMLESVDESDDDDSDDEDEEDEADSDDEDADKDEEAGTGAEGESDEDGGAGSDDGSDDADTDEDWAPDGMKEKLQRALKVFVLPAAAEALEAAQLTMTLAEAVPGAGAKIAGEMVRGAEGAAAGSDEQFAAAFSATVAMGEVDARTTWASDPEVAQDLLARLGKVWRGLFLGLAGGAARAGSGAAGGAPEGKRSKKTAVVKKTPPPPTRTGMGVLADDCQAALGSYLEKLKQKWGGGGDGCEEDEEGVAEEEVLNLTFDFGGPEAPAGATPKAAAALAAKAEADSKAAVAAGAPNTGNKRLRK